MIVLLFRLPLHKSIIFSQCDDRSEHFGATSCFLPLSKHMPDCYQQISRSFQIMLLIKQLLLIKLPYRYFYKSLALYQNFFCSRQIGLLAFSAYSPQSAMLHTSTDYSSTGSVYSSPTTRILLLIYFMMIQCDFISSFWILITIRISIKDLFQQVSPPKFISIPHFSAQVKNYSAPS